MVKGRGLPCLGQDGKGKEQVNEKIRCFTKVRPLDTEAKRKGKKPKGGLRSKQREGLGPGWQSALGIPRKWVNWWGGRSWTMGSPHEPGGEKKKKKKRPNGFAGSGEIWGGKEILACTAPLLGGNVQ